MQPMSEPHPSSTSPEVAYSLGTPYRDVTCGGLRSKDDDRTVRMAGWVHRRRDLGHLIFIDLRDRFGITQVVVDADQAPAAHAVASRVRGEFVIEVTGLVEDRLPGTHNPKLATGDIEVRATSVEILNEAQTPPFYINDPDADVDEIAAAQVPLPRHPPRARCSTACCFASELVKAIRDTITGPGSSRSRRRSCSSPRPRGRATISCLAACTRARSTRCRSRPSSSSSC